MKRGGAALDQFLSLYTEGKDLVRRGIDLDIEGAEMTMAASRSRRPAPWDEALFERGIALQEKGYELCRRGEDLLSRALRLFPEAFYLLEGGS